MKTTEQEIHALTIKYEQLRPLTESEKHHDRYAQEYPALYMRHEGRVVRVLAIWNDGNEFIMSVVNADVLPTSIEGHPSYTQMRLSRITRPIVYYRFINRLKAFVNMYHVTER